MSDCKQPFKRTIELIQSSDDANASENFELKYFPDQPDGALIFTATIVVDAAEIEAGTEDPLFFLAHKRRTDDSNWFADQLEATKTAIAAMQDAVDLCEKAKAMLKEGKSAVDVKAEMLRLHAGTDTFKQVERPRKRNIVVANLGGDFVVVEGTVFQGKEDTIAFNKKHNDAFEITVRDATPEESAYWLYTLKHQSPRVYDNTGLMNPPEPYPYPKA
jgi:hypothetical protein